jgi:hypothetical protein
MLQHNDRPFQHSHFFTPLLSRVLPLERLNLDVGTRNVQCSRIADVNLSSEAGDHAGVVFPDSGFSKFFPG